MKNDEITRISQIFGGNVKFWKQVGLGLKPPGKVWKSQLFHFKGTFGGPKVSNFPIRNTWEPVFGNYFDYLQTD